MNMDETLSPEASAWSLVWLIEFLGLHVKLFCYENFIISF